MRTSFPKLAAAAAAVVLAGCGDGTGPSHQEPPLSIVAGSGATDTVLAKLTQALVVEVHGPDGRPLPDLVVRFTSVPQTVGFGAAVFVAPLTASFYTTFASDSTNSRGQASVLVQLGQIAGPAKIHINVPELGLQDTARYTVLPGAASMITMSIRDTTVWRGEQYSISASVADRFGNRRPNDAVTYTSRSAVATVDNTGKVTAAQEGRGTIVIQSASAKDSVQLSVVPQGALVIWGGGKLSTVNTNGSQLKQLTTSPHSSLFPQWSPDGTKVLIYEADPASDARMSLVDMNGARTLVAGPGGTLRAASYGRFTRDGSWIYFSGISTTEYGYVTWRVKSDGTQLEQVGPTVSEGGSLRPDISPDGKTEVFQTAGGVIGTMDLATHAIKSLGISGSFPRYSPDGTQIAYLSGPYGQYGPMQLFVMKADGTGSRQVSNSALSYQDAGGVDWSPDGLWLLASTYISFELVRVSDGLRLPLRASGLQGAWKP